MATSAVPLLVLLLVAAAHAGYLSPYHLPAPLPPPVVSYGYTTAVVSKPVLPLHPYPLHPVHPVHVPVLPPPVYVKPIATSYQSFHKIDRPAYYPLHYVKPLPVPIALPHHLPHHLPHPLPLAYGHHYPHYLH